MVDKIKALLIKYREFIVYFIVGCLTTLVAALARFGFNFLFFGGTAHPSSLLSGFFLNTKSLLRT